MGPFLIILGWLLIVGSGAFLYWRLRFYKKQDVKELNKNELILVLLGVGGAGIGGICSNIGYALTGSWAIDAGHYVMLLIGGFLFFASAAVLASTFYLHFYRKDWKKEQHRIFSILLIVSSFAALGSFLLAGEGMAPYLTYPLVCGFSINNAGWVWNRPGSGTSGFTVTWYGVVIVVGAIIAYKLSDHHMYQRYGRHGIIDTCFLIAFPCGILAARIWYVVGNWNGDGAGGPNFSEIVASGQWYRIFAIWEGGLTILGGAVGGIIGGVLYMVFKRKWCDVRFAMDVIVPTILIAQAIGRWGNFFNREVYGNLSQMDAWPLVPTWIRYNMAETFTAGLPSSGNMYIPLFLIEGFFNVLGYFVIYHLVRRVWKEKYRALGCLSGVYLIWYGIVRMIMEPMRDPSYNMGADGSWSFWNSMVYIILGVVVIGGFYAFAYWRKKTGRAKWIGINFDDQGNRIPTAEEAKALEKPAETPANLEPPLVEKPKAKDPLSAPKRIKRPGEDETKDGE